MAKENATKIAVWSEVIGKRNVVFLTINGLRLSTEADTKETAMALVFRLASDLGIKDPESNV